MKKLIVLILIVLINSVKAQIPTTGLLGYFPFVGNANDLSGNLQNGTVNGATLTADRFGNPNSAYSFNGLSDYIALLPINYIGLNNYSYSLWFKPAGNTNNGRIICIGENGGICQSLTHQTTGYVFASSFNMGANPNLSYSQSSTLTLNQWYHVVVTRDNSDIKMYLNGLFVASQTPTNTNTQAAAYGTVTPYRALIGARSSLGANFFFDGVIDDVRIYSVVLNQNDVNALYNESPCYQNIPVITVPSPIICSGTSAYMLVSGLGNASIAWYATAASTVPIATGSLFTIPALTTTSGQSTYTYFAEVNSCTLYPRTAITVTINPLPKLNTSINTGTICNGETLTLSVSGAASYVWNPGTIAGSVIAVTPTSSTNYTVSGLDSITSCSNSNQIALTVNACVGIVENYQAIDLSFFPNPAKDVVEIKSYSALKISYALTDLFGRELMRGEFSQQECLDVSQLKSGIYFINFQNGTNRLTKKLIVQND